MGNAKSEFATKSKLVGQIKTILRNKREKQESFTYCSQFNKLSSSIISIITSFLTLHEFNEMLMVSHQTYELFISASGCFQIKCQKLLNIQCELIQSNNWRIILQSLLYIPIKGIPYERAIKSVRYDVKQHPVFFEDKVEYSTFQKCILYFENQFNQSENTKEFQQIKNFSYQNIDLLLKLRQGCEINIQLPQLLMNIYNIHDFIKIYNLSLEIRFSKCNLQSFLDLWDHYCGWISIMEWSTEQLLSEFNLIISEVLNKFKLPKYTIRHFMVSLWLEQANKVTNTLREEFKLKLKKSRKENKKIYYLRKYIKYLIDISTNQQNVYQYGCFRFLYCQELHSLVNIGIQMTENINQDYLIDEQILLYTYGEWIYYSLLFEKLSSYRISQLKQEILQLQYEITNKKLQQDMDDKSDHQLNHSSNKQQNPFIIAQYNPIAQIRVLFKSINIPQDVKESENEQKIENISESLGASGISFTSTNCSSIFSSFKSNDQLLNYVRNNQLALYHKIEHFYLLQEKIQELAQETLEQNRQSYDIPELCEYHIIPFDRLVEYLRQVKASVPKEEKFCSIDTQSIASSIYGRTTAQQMLLKIVS